MSACVTYRSPLHHVGTVQTRVKPLPSPGAMLEMERSFVNDGVRTVVFNRPRGLPIIPPYSARVDPGARGYIQSPRVQNILQYTIEGKERPERPNRNKLSSRGRCIPSPEPEIIAGREERYVNDAVKAERLRTKYRDTLLRPYNALTDPGCRDYFQRKDIQVLLIRTSSTSPTSSMTSSSMTSSVNSSRSSMGRSSRSSHAGNTSPERRKTSPYRRYRGSSPVKSRTTTREESRDNMPVTRSQSKSPGNENKNKNDNNSNSRTKSSNNTPAPKRSPTSPRIPEEPLAEPVRTNKLSSRGRCIPTPPPDVIRQREQQFVLDSITTDKNRTKYRDIIPRYNAVRDVHAKAYFKRDDVQDLMNVTCTLKPWEKDIKDETKK